MTTNNQHQAALSAVLATLASHGLITTNSPMCQDTPSFNVDGAFDVVEQLREQPGVQALKHGVWQYLIEAKTADSNGGVRLEVLKRRDRSVKLSRSFSPAFDTEANAKAAINAVGEATILAAMKALTASA